MDLSALQRLLESAAGARIACVGDIMLDRHVTGEVERISPEAPIPVLRATSETSTLGAAGNVARNVVSLGGVATLTGLVGDDEAGREIVRLAKMDPGLQSALAVAPGRPTTVKTRYVASGQQLLRVDAEDVGAPDSAASEALVQAVRGAVAGAACIALSDYAKGALSSAVIEACLTAGVPVVVDPKRRPFADYGACDLLKPNALELAWATGLPTQTDDEVEAALARALSACAAKAILVTRAASGMSLARRDGGVVHFRARPREVFDVTGAGDTALAALSLAIAAGAVLEEAAEFSILASGVAVEKAGTAVVTPAELIEAELSARLAPAEAKIAAHAGVLEAVKAWRAKGLRIGFTNGCFDILHRGHIAYLAQARSWCDRLIVGVNDDASVRALKGEGRPVNALESRALVLASLTSVDLVTAFSDPTPIALIEAIRPDVLVKGADYALSQVVGADLVMGWGGEVRLADTIDGFSTTSAIERMRAKA